MPTCDLCGEEKQSEEISQEQLMESNRGLRRHRDELQARITAYQEREWREAQLIEALEAYSDAMDRIWSCHLKEKTPTCDCEFCAARRAVEKPGYMEVDLERYIHTTIRLRGRIRKAAQTLIEEIGADGPESLEQTVKRAVTELGRIKAENKRIAAQLDKQNGWSKA